MSEKGLRKKRFLLMRDNVHSYISDKITELIKNIKMKEYKDWPLFSPDLNPIENIWKIIKSQLMKRINKKSELILEILSAYDSINDETI